MPSVRLWSLWVTATEAAGKARVAIASVRTGKGRRKDAVLMFEGWRQGWNRTVQGWDRSGEIRGLCGL